MEYKATKRIVMYFTIDEINHLFKIKKEVFSYSDFQECSVEEDGETIAKTSLAKAMGRGLVGGVLLGPAGVLVGGLTTSKTTKEVCTSMNVAVIMKDGRKAEIPLIMSKVKKKGTSYKIATESAQKCLDTFAEIAKYNAE